MPTADDSDWDDDDDLSDLAEIGEGSKTLHTSAGSTTKPSGGVSDIRARIESQLLVRSITASSSLLGF